MTKVLFLDVDGVLNSARTWKTRVEGMAAEHVALVAHILRETGASVVVSSTWRTFPGWNDGASQFHKTLAKHGADGALILSRVIGRTVDGWEMQLPKTDGRLLRGTEIQHWLDARQVECFVILDDDGDMGPLTTRLVQTTFDDGLTPELADRAIEMLGGAA